MYAVLIEVDDIPQLDQSCASCAVHATAHIRKMILPSHKSTKHINISLIVHCLLLSAFQPRTKI